MERLTTQHWSLIARYLKKEETSQKDLIQLNNILNTYPGLKDELKKIDECSNEPSRSDKEFDAVKAFKKLHERFKRENLI